MKAQRNYLKPLLINLLFILPLLQFLLWPDTANNGLMSKLQYILLLKFVSFIITSQFMIHRQDKKLNIRSLLNLVVPVYILVMLYREIGAVTAVYFIGNLLIDFILISRMHVKKVGDLFIGGIYRIILVVLLMFPALLLGHIIGSRYEQVFLANPASYSDYGDPQSMTGVIVLVVLYYLLEPFSSEIVATALDPKSKVNRYLTKKVKF